MFKPYRWQFVLNHAPGGYGALWYAIGCRHPPYIKQDGEMQSGVRHDIIQSVVIVSWCFTVSGFLLPAQGWSTRHLNTAKPCYWYWWCLPAVQCRHQGRNSRLLAIWYLVSFVHRSVLFFYNFPMLQYGEYHGFVWWRHIKNLLQFGGIPVKGNGSCFGFPCITR